MATPLTVEELPTDRVKSTVHLYIVIAFALLIWWTRDTPFEPLITSPLGSGMVVLGQMGVVYVLARMSSHSALRLFASRPSEAQHRHHRTSLWIRTYILFAFTMNLTITSWPQIVMTNQAIAKIPALAEFIVIAPFIVSTIILFWASYPIDCAIRRTAFESLAWHAGPTHHSWGRWEYMNFNVRHHILSVVVPMMIILVFHSLTRDHEAAIARLIPLPWVSDMALGAAAAGVFVAAPWLLKHIWTTQPLPVGKLRSDLENICRRIGLKCRDILVWNSGGMYVNAAVMGLFAPVRYVMLSDGLLESMNDKQIEAVFGHEAGHVRHKHIPFFLLFALATMLIASGVMELLYRGSLGPGGAERLSPSAIQAIGFMVIVALWWGGFGFVSRRFERQADLFGARCVTPDGANECAAPCGVHDRDAVGAATGPASADHLCATGAGIFAGALDRVALLNGIPHEEPSWRHSSIASRIEFLTKLSADPDRVRRFSRVIGVIKIALIVICIVGLAISAYYLWPYWTTAMSKISSGPRPFHAPPPLGT